MGKSRTSRSNGARKLAMTKERRRAIMLRQTINFSERQKRDLRRLRFNSLVNHIMVLLVVLGMLSIIGLTLYLAIF